MQDRSSYSILLFMADGDCFSLCVVHVICFKNNILHCVMLTVKGDIEQTDQSSTALIGNTRSLRSRHGEDVSKKTLSAEKGLKLMPPSGASKLLAADSSGTKTVSLPQHVSTRSSARRDSESALHTSTPVKSIARKTPLLKSASISASPQSSAAAPDLQDGDDSDDKTVQSSQSMSPRTASPVSTRSRSGMSSSPEKYNQDTNTSHGLPWTKQTNIITYQRKPAADKRQKSNSLRPTLRSETHVLNADVSSRERPRKVHKTQVRDGSGSKASSKLSSGEDVEFGSDMSSSPEKPVRYTDASHGLPRSKVAGIITRHRKHLADKMRTRNSSRSMLSSKIRLSTANVIRRERYGRPHKIEKIKMPDGSGSKTSCKLSVGDDAEIGNGRDKKFLRKRRDVAVQADSQSSVSSPRALRYSKLHSASSSLVSSPSRSCSKVVIESCSSGKTATTAKSSVQYDTCFETASSQPHVTDDTDDEELYRMARLAHGSPQYAVVPTSSDDETVTSGTPVKLRGSHMKRRSTTPTEQLRHLSALSGENPSTVHAQHVDAVADDMSRGLLDSDGASSRKQRRTEIDKKEVKGHLPKSSRATLHLAEDGGKKTVESASSRDDVTAALSQCHSRVDDSVSSAEEVSSSRVENASVEPVAGPSGIALRTQSCQNASREKSHASG